MRYWHKALSVGILLAALITPARAEQSELRIAYQYGLLFLPLIIMDHQGLVQKQAKAAGLPEVKVAFQQVTGGNIMNEGLLSGNLDIASGGVPPFLLLWAKTKGNADVKAIAAMCSMPIYLNTRNPRIKSLQDFTDQDRIALPAQKVSIQAIMLQMAAEKVFGRGNHTKLDAITVSLAHPLAMSSLLSEGSEVNSHFASPPYNYQEVRFPQIRTVLNSYDILGPATFEVVWTTAKFRAENPKLYKVFLDAFAEAISLINNDRQRTAEIYLQATKDKMTVEDVVKILEDPQVGYTTMPAGIDIYTDFMHRVGSIKVRPEDWRSELFFPDVFELPKK